MRNVLQWPHIRLRPRGATADQQYGNARKPSIGDCGDGIGDSGPGGHHRNAELPSQLSMRMRHMNGGPLVTHIDYADVLASDVVPDRLNMAALQPENSVNATHF